MSVCLSVAYIKPKLRTERPRKTKIGTEVAHVTRDSDTTFKVKRSKVNLQGARAYFGGLLRSYVSEFYIFLLLRLLSCCHCQCWLQNTLICKPRPIVYTMSWFHHQELPSFRNFHLLIFWRTQLSFICPWRITFQRVCRKARLQTKHK